MKYPMLNNWLVFQYKDQHTYNVRDGLSGEEFVMGKTLARFGQKLTGNQNPYSADSSLSVDDVESMLRVLENNSMLRHSRILMMSFGSIYLSLWFPKQSKILRALGCFINGLLKTLWLPTFIAGVAMFYRYLPINNTDHMLFGCIAGIITGIFCHEMGHACAGIANGAHVYEMGIMIHNFIPGAYCLLDSNVKGKMKRIQIKESGLEANCLLSGVFLLLACIWPNWGAAFLCAAINNVLLVAINTIFIEGLDGTSIIEELLGIDDLVNTAKKVVSNRKLRNQLRTRGATGYVLVIICYFAYWMQIALPLVIGMNVLEVISWFL